MKRFDPYHTWLGIPPEEQPPNHYRLLGISLFESDRDVIRNAADQRMTYLKTYGGGQHSELSQQLLNEVSAAKVCLVNADKKAAYDAWLRQQLEPSVAERVPTESVEPESAEDEQLPPIVTKPKGAPPRGRRNKDRSFPRRGRPRLPVLGIVVAVILVLLFFWLIFPSDHGTLTLKIEPVGVPRDIHVKVDGKVVKKFDVLREPRKMQMKLAPEQHEIVVSGPDFRPQRRLVRIQAGEETTLTVALVRPRPPVERDDGGPSRASDDEPPLATAVEDGSRPTQPASPSSSSPIVSDFENGPAGWLVHNWTPETPIPNKYSWTPRLSPGGNPGSCLMFEDPQDGKAWGWHASNAHYGNQAHRLGKYIYFDIRATHVDDPNGTYNVGLTGYTNDGRVYIRTKVPRPPRNTWTSYCLKLGPEAYWRFPTDDDHEPRRATSENIASILTNLIDWRIQGELAYGKDVGFLDNVVFGGGPPLLTVDYLSQRTDGAMRELKFQVRLHDKRGRRVRANFPVRVECRARTPAGSVPEGLQTPESHTVVLEAYKSEELVTVRVAEQSGKAISMELAECENAVLDQSFISIP